MRENHPRERQLAKERNKLARRKASRANLPTALIVCEGKKTEPAYLRGLLEQLRVNPANAQIVEGISDTDAVSVVKRAKQLFEASPDFDHVLVVLDAEQNNLPPALKLASVQLRRADRQKISIQPIITNPCFEFWLLLHFTFTTKAYRNFTDLRDDLLAYLPNYQKADRNIFTLCAHGLDAALANAIKLKAALKSSNADCPDTDMHVLVKLLQSMIRK